MIGPLAWSIVLAVLVPNFMQRGHTWVLDTPMSRGQNEAIAAEAVSASVIVVHAISCMFGMRALSRGETVRTGDFSAGCRNAG